jgi:hypothetical protein
MTQHARHHWRALTADSGQSLVVVIVSLGVLLGMAAFGIDTATWMVKRHNDQVVADAAALAAANCLAHPSKTPTSIVINGSQTSVPACTSGTDSADAQTVAVDYAAANGLTITSSEVNVNTGAGTVQVTAPSTSPGFFARLFGIDQATQAAAAKAAWTTGSGICPDPGTDSACGFMFAEDSTCTSWSTGIYLTMSGNSNVSGTIVSNSNLSGATSGNISLGTATYGPGGCSNTVAYAGHDPWSSPPSQASTDYPYPINYAEDFPACGGSGEAACETSGDGPLAGYPSFCTNAGANITLTGSTNGDSAINDNIYCASGTGTPSQPSTWNGSITIDLSGKDTLFDTFVGGTITFTGSGNDVLSACGYTTAGYAAANCAASVPAPTTPNYPIFYATGTSSTALNVTIAGGQVVNGDMFVPNGTAYLSMAGNKTLTTFVEGYDVNASISGTFQGDGPTSSGGGGSSGGSDSLVQ